MKNTFFGLAILLSFGLVACEKPEGKEFDPRMNCWIFVSTIPGEETILLAQSGLTLEGARRIEAGFKKKYGDRNVIPDFSYPGGLNADGHVDFSDYPDMDTECYEITMTIDFPSSSVPSVKSLRDYGFRAVKIIGRTAICKEYVWSYTEEGANRYIAREESGYRHAPDYVSGGTIVGETTIKNLGSHVENMPIKF